MANKTFPANFKFGVADSDLQTIGEDFTRQFEDSEQTMWDTFAKTSGKVFNNDTPGQGIDKFHHYKEDVQILKELGINNYRTSISMARLLKRNGEVNEKAVEWYKKFFTELRNRNISIYLTLYHWELPEYLSVEGGWTNKETIDVFIKHSLVAVEYFKEYINEFFILNEPWASGFVGHYYGVHAPGETSLKSALSCIHNLLLAQGIVFNEIKNKYPEVKLGTVLNVAKAYPSTQEEDDILAAKYCDGFYNRWFLDPIFKGKYPEDMLVLFKDYLPEFSEEEMKTIKIGGRLNSLGINYYNGHIVKREQDNPLGFEDIYDMNKFHNDLGWALFMQPDYPEGLHDILVQIHEMYQPKRIYITENGSAFKSTWDGISTLVEDPRRIEFLSNHIEQVRKAIDENVPIEGYFAWTFMDNYEWSEGYKPESAFGLVYVDRKTMKRVYKTSALWYRDLITHEIQINSEQALEVSNSVIRTALNKDFG